VTATSQHKPLPEFKWDDIRVLAALVRAGTVRGAALALDVNPSTVGRRLDALEEELGVRLFERTPDGVVPTAAGEQLFPFAEGMERAAADLRIALDGLETEVEGVVRITAPPGVVSEFVTPRLDELLELHPKIRLEVDASVAYADLTRRDADIALRAARPARGDLVATRLVQVASVPLAAPSYIERLGVVEDFHAIRWTTWTDALAHIPDARWVLSQAREEALVIRTDRMEAQLAAARSGLCAVLTAAPYEGLPGLRRLTIAPSLFSRLPPLPEQELWLVGHRALRDVPRVAAVWDWLKRVFTAGAE